MDNKFTCWPVASIAYFARRNGMLYASLSTWYKYLPLLGIERNLFRALKKTCGIRATSVNEFLHVDTTLYTLGNGTKMAIAFVSDNFSRAILGWGIEMRNCAGNVSTALSMAIETMRNCHPGQICATLVADGGSENHAVTIAELLEQTHNPKITKIIALKDIAYSNSPVEAVNKIMKKYIRHHAPQTDKALTKVIELAVADYNLTRPHNSLKGATPMEIYKGTSPKLDFTGEMELAKAARIAANRQFNCGKCERIG